MGDIIWATFPQHKPRPVEVKPPVIITNPEEIIWHPCDVSNWFCAAPSEMPPPEAS